MLCSLRDINLIMTSKGKKKNDKVKTEAIVELPVKPPELNVADINKCPTYVPGVKKERKGVKLKDLLSLQHELEYMLVCTTRRQEQLKTEISSLDNPAATRNKRSRSSDSVGKKSGNTPKKGKGKGKKAMPSRPKIKFIQPPPRSYECGVTDAQVQVDNSKPPKNDGQSRFWSFIEPYCANITDDDTKAIEGWIKAHDDDLGYQKIPDLGCHFSEKWAKEDLDEEIKEGSKSVEQQKGCLESDIALSNKERVLRIGEKERKKCEKNSGDLINSSLKQRLISALVQENVIAPPDVCLTEPSKDENHETSQPSMSSKSISPSKESFQKRICKGLSEIDERGLI